MIKTFSYHALKPAISLCIIGAIHGNEKCGTLAIQRLINEIENRYILLKQGSLHLMPIANPKAYEQDVRFIERNLNRHLYIKQQKNHYEDYLDQTICEFIDKADFLLDLHSYASESAIEQDAFIFLGGNDIKEINYAKSLGVNNFIYGWQEAFTKFSQTNEFDSKEAQGTAEYARLKNITAVTLECGQHLSILAPDIAYKAIINSLIYFDMLDENCLIFNQYNSLINNNNNIINNSNNHNKLNNKLCIHMQEVYYKNEGDILFKLWKHFEKIEKGQILFYKENGSIIKANNDGYILLPKLNASNNCEWFYFGVETSLDNL